LNQDSYSKWSVLDKITQTLEFEKAGIPHIKNLNPTDAKYPYIVKNKLGSHGDSVYKITCREDLDKVLEIHKKEDLLFQEFQTSGFDLRVIVLGAARLGASRGKVLGVMKRTPREGEFLSNYSQGGKIQEYEDKSDESISQIALKTAEHFKLDYVGVDLMLNNQKEWVVLEVNRACQFKGFEQATGVNIASKVVDFLIQ
jgi:RimK family alpha-L-glutamate ligase